MQMKNKGYGNRFAQDFGGNHLQQMRERSSCGMFLDYAHKFCAACKTKKPTKGGGYIGKVFVCAECKQ
jgi:hypothetical protein